MVCLSHRNSKGQFEMLQVTRSLQSGTARDHQEQPGTARGLEIAPGYIIVLNKLLF
jgi:hypothetical protein